MNDFNAHDTLYAPYGGFIPNEESNGGVLLKKRYTSVVYCPQMNEQAPGAMYPRAIVLQHNGEMNGNILATFECYSYDAPVFPIYESRDDARSWQRVSEIADTESGFGCRYQPHLYELPCKSGDLDEGTILCAGNIIPQDISSTSLRLYKSCDAGRTWEYISEIAAGGRALVDMEGEVERPVWEPFLICDKDGRLFCYYSDERYAGDYNYNQLLAHKISEDGGKSWSEARIDVAYGDGRLRPGMPVIAALSNGKYAMTYEMVNQDRIPVYFRISDTLDDWGNVDYMGNPVIAMDGRYLTGTPYITWIPQGGKRGTILASGRGFGHILTNSDDGNGFWSVMDSLLPIDHSVGFTGYSQCLVPLHGGRQILNLCPVQISGELAMIEAAVADVYVKAE